MNALTWPPRALGNNQQTIDYSLLKNPEDRRRNETRKMKEIKMKWERNVCMISYQQSSQQPQMIPWNKASM